MLMRKLLILFILFQTTFSFTQYVEITPQGGFFFGGRARFIQGDIAIRGNGCWGFNLASDFGYDGGLEFSYVGMVSDANFFARHQDYTNDDFKIGCHYFQLGVYQDFGNDKIKGYGNFSAGASMFQVMGDRAVPIKWNFATSLSLGLKYFFTDYIGFKIYGRVLLPLEFAGVGAYCGIGFNGPNCGLGVNSYSFIVQGDIGGGLVFRIGY